MAHFTQPQYPALTYSDTADFEWPHGNRCGVTLDWHVDGEAGPVGWDADAVNHVAEISEAANGVTTALPRILELHRDSTYRSSRPDRLDDQILLQGADAFIGQHPLK